MNTSAPANYVIRIDGHLGEHCSASLVGMSIIRDSDGTTTIAGPVADQDQLHQVIARLGDAGTTLLEVHTDRQRTAETRIHTQPDMPPVLDRALHSERLTLRPAVLSDAEATWTFRQLSVVNEWLTGCPADIASYRDLWADPERLATTVVIQLGHDRDAEVIGDFMLRREDAWAQLEMAEQARGMQAELGFVLDPAHNGHGYATEAVRELLRYSFEDLGVRRVVANCFLDNDTSWRLMERVGMRRELHAVSESLHRSGKWLDTVAYALLYDDWSR
jgi:RimJ/RimL family protein N-acetyltransferase